MAFSFVDFCAGVGGGRLGLEGCGLRCVGFAEIDEVCVRVYRGVFGKEEKNFGDLFEKNFFSLPDFDFLIAGFPCQSFSVLGKREGLGDKRGQLIFRIVEALRAKKPTGFVLENVKGLFSVDGGAAFRQILKLLSEAGYSVFHSVLNSLHFGVPQSRERLFFVGFRNDAVGAKRFKFPEPQGSYELSDFLLCAQPLNGYEISKLEKYLARQKTKISISELLQNDFLVLDTRQTSLRLFSRYFPTLRASRHGLFYVWKREIFKLSAIEALLLQGWKLDLAMKARKYASETALLSRAGNALTVNVVEALGREILRVL